MKKNIILLLLIMLICISCSNSNKPLNNTVVVSIPSDVTTINPFFAMNVKEGQISERIFHGLIAFDWDSTKGKIYPLPMVAKSWLWNSDSSAVQFTLRKKLLWSDSVNFSMDDIIYSFKTASNPEVKSRYFGMFDNLILNNDLSINIDKTFEIINDSTLKVNLNKNSKGVLLNLDMPLIAKHIWKNVPASELENSEYNNNPVGLGAFKLKSWKRNQSIILERNPLSYLFDKCKLKYLVFKIVPNYNSALLQLLKGEVDILSNITPVSYNQVSAAENIKLKSVDGRAFDYLSFNTEAEFKSVNNENKTIRIFKNSKVRRALSLAIDRKLLVDQVLNSNGQVCIGPISYIFKYNLIDTNAKHFAPKKATLLLAEEGWEDTNSDGILDKDGVEFSFTISIPGGNDIRKQTAEIIKNQYASIGIYVNIESIEPNVFFQKLYSKSLQSAIAGWIIPIPLELRPFWHSDPDVGQVNISNYSNENVDEIINEIYSSPNNINNNKLIAKFQTEITNDPPVAFLFWTSNIVAINKRVKGIDVNPLGEIQKCWQWNVK